MPNGVIPLLHLLDITFLCVRIGTRVGFQNQNRKVLYDDHHFNQFTLKKLVVDLFELLNLSSK